MNAYAKIDHSALVRNLNVVCRELGQVMDSSGLYCGPPALTEESVVEDIPGILHKIAIAAGWIDRKVELEPEDFDSGRAELLGGVLVDGAYLEWFLGLVSKTLDDLAAQAAANRPVQEEDYQRLLKLSANGISPPKTRDSADNRKRKAERVKRNWPTKYPDGAETPKGILDRRRIHGLHLEWAAFAKRVQDEWTRRESQRRRQVGMEPTDKLGFSVDLLMAMRRGHTPAQLRLEAVAAAISDAKETISWTQLQWRDPSTDE